MKMWIDDIRVAPHGYVWCKTVDEAIHTLSVFHEYIELIDTDHDAGKYAEYGGDYIRVLDWLAFMEYDIPIRIHSANPVGVDNMRRMIRRYGWTEVF